MHEVIRNLGPGRREEIARGCFEVKSKAGDELHGLCPIHKEVNPSFSYNTEKDVSHCLSCGQGGGLVKLWCHKYGYADDNEGFKAFCRAHVIEHLHQGPKRSHPAASRNEKKSAAEVIKPKLADIQEAYDRFPQLPEEWIKKLESQLGWTPEVMSALGLRLQTHYWDKKTGTLKEIAKDRQKRVAIPIYDQSGRLRNIRLYHPNPKKREPKIISFGPGCGESRLFPAGPKPVGLVLLCEGEKDTICVLSAGFNAITQTSKMKAWKPDHTSPFNGRDVVIAYDADQPGQKYAGFAAEALKGSARSIRLLEWPESMGRKADGSYPKKGGEDLTDFFQKHRKTAVDLRELIAKARPYQTPKVADSPENQATVMQYWGMGVNGRKSFKPRLLADRVSKDEDIVYDPNTTLAYRWNGRSYEVLPHDYIEAACLRYLGDEAQTGRARDAANQVLKLNAIPHGREMNDRADWLCLENCMLNIETLDKKPHDRNFFATSRLPIIWDPTSEEQPHTLLGILKENIQTREPIMQLQEFFGYCLTKHVRYEIALLLLGPGADGKSTILSILQAMIGEENCSSISFEDLNDQFMRASLYGKHLNTSTEVGAKALESQHFKGIVSGDLLSAAFKHRDVFSFKPFCKLAFASNKLPRVLDNSDGFFRRLLIIQFKRQFLPGDPCRDENLKEKLLDELSLIFEWAIVGYHRLKKQGRFTWCDETAALMQSYKRLNNPILCFCEDRLEFGEDKRTKNDDLYDEYSKYCGQFGYGRSHKENFMRELFAIKSQLSKERPRINGKRPRCVRGVGLRSYDDLG